MRSSFTTRSVCGAVLCCLVFALLPAGGGAEVPQLINYQGRLADDVGNPVANGDYEMVFTIYDSPTDGQVLWTSSPQMVPVEGGTFTYLLGFAETLPDDLFSTDTVRYLGVLVGQEEILPRMRLTSVPYAYQALRADTADIALQGSGLSGSGSANYIAKFTAATTLGNSALYQATNGRIGKGLTNPMAEFHIHHEESGVRLTNTASGADWNDGIQIGWWTSGSINAIMWNRENGFLSFGTSNQEQLRITSGGSFGFGTANPGFKLDARGSSADDGAMLQLGNVDSSHFLRLFPGHSTDPNPFVQWRQGDPLRFATNSGGFLEMMRISVIGNVGIGTTNPTSKLQVAGMIHSTTGGYRFPDGSIQVTASTGGAGGGWVDLGTVISTSNPLDSVAVGTIYPTARVDVRGDDQAIRASADSSVAFPDYDWVQMRYLSGFGPMVEGSENIWPPKLILDAKQQGMEDGGTIVAGLNGDNVIINAPGPMYGSGYQLDVVSGSANFGGDIVLDQGAALIETGYIGDSSMNVMAGPGRGLWLGADNSYGSSGIYISENGDVGIGQTNPSQTFDVAGWASIQGQLDMNQSKIVNVGKPTAVSDAANKFYVDSVSAAAGVDGDWTVSGNDVYLTPTGNVGLGVTSPAEKLDVDGDIRLRGADLKDAGGTTRLTVTDDGALDLKEDDGVVALSVATDGKVAIGHSSPAARLDIDGDLRVRGNDIKDIDGTSRVVLNDFDKLHLCDSLGATRLTIATNGNVGIWNMAPTYHLDVAGDIGLDDTLHHNGDG
ncbi:MAG: hypothetical protein JSU65_02370, partial [Candidatus Zixiibacteriota bacterium]